ncbi:MAG: hypothetical protein HOI23_23555 [Deltaproteobacteria bacterium]|jgi:hypothetical protein|nr:hypothetical protein [Deltaproteobacteria bacterium]MBT6433880.1 hypothetical protein [Deltaproteobacteria bacterium]MBT6491071.1 hypothetical protein [Deltaproteobacteria bacterium]
MRAQLWQYALMRPATLTSLGVGLWFILRPVYLGLGVALVLYGIYRAIQFVDKTPDAEERLFLRKEKRHHGIKRKLNTKEQKQLMQLLKYTRRLEELGGDPVLSQEIWSQAWMAIETNQDKNSNQELELLIASLPELQATGSKPQEDLLNRLRKECEIIWASQAEANASSSAKNYKL